MTDGTITPEQCRAARAILRWTLDDLAGAARVSKPTLSSFENGTAQPYDRTLRDIRAAIEGAGVTLHDNGCVCPPKKTG